MSEPRERARVAEAGGGLLKSQGVLTDEEFQDRKGRLLAF